MTGANRIVLASPLVAALLGGAVFGFGRVESTPLGCGEEPIIGVAGGRSALADGRGTPAIVGDKIVVLEGLGNRSAYFPATGAKGLLRHVASALGWGTAYVDDRNGPDGVVVVRPQGVSEILAAGEVTHPAWSPAGDLVWAEDFKTLKKSSPTDPSPNTIARPQGSTAVFSPLFTGQNELIAVVQEPVEGDIGEDDTLNNLYRYDMGSRSWSRVTSFVATAEYWSVLRTPVLGPDGSVFFLRLRGMASEPRPPSFELWALRGDDSVSKVRDLPKEMYLAGVDQQGLLWNIYDGTEWRLFQESGSGFADLGCGAVMVDPRSQPDPDIPRVDPSLERRTSSGRKAAPDGPTSLVDAEMAILVGDFSSRQGAQAVASSLGIPGLEIVNHGLAPFAIAPGKWGVAKRLLADADLTLEVGEFRRMFPQYVDRSWIVSLSGGSQSG